MWAKIYASKKKISTNIGENIRATNLEFRDLFFCHLQKFTLVGESGCFQQIREQTVLWLLWYTFIGHLIIQILQAF